MTCRAARRKLEFNPAAGGKASVQTSSHTFFGIIADYRLTQNPANLFFHRMAVAGRHQT